MERFVTRHQGRIAGILSGFDRMIFRGTLRSLSYPAGLEAFLATPFSGGDRHARRIALLTEFERTGTPPPLPS